MEIVRERFLDESRVSHVTLGLRSRTTEMHSALSALTTAEREQIGHALVRALDDIERVVRPHLPATTK
ncbi:MAG: hypothetical protein ACRD2N_07185 [Vicinamibacterales bacterium]